MSQASLAMDTEARTSLGSKMPVSDVFSSVYDHSGVGPMLWEKIQLPIQ
jgi:hypothetical protein